MKTAISLRDQTFERVNRKAAEMRMSRSEFFARAAERYLEQLESTSVTAAIDEVLGLRTVARMLRYSERR